MSPTYQLAITDDRTGESGSTMFEAADMDEALEVLDGATIADNETVTITEDGDEYLETPEAHYD